MAEMILQYLMWAIPSGGVGAAIAGIANRKIRSAKVAKEVHDTYKTMYEDISSLLVETQKKYEDTTEKIEELGTENARTRRALNRLSRAIEAIQVCPYRSTCPVSGELSVDENGDDGRPHPGKRDGGKHDERNRDKANTLEGADVFRKPDPELGQSATAAIRRGLHGQARPGERESNTDPPNGDKAGASVG